MAAKKTCGGLRILLNYASLIILTCCISAGRFNIFMGQCMHRRTYVNIGPVSPNSWPGKCWRGNQHDRTHILILAFNRRPGMGSGSDMDL